MCTYIQLLTCFLSRPYLWIISSDPGHRIRDRYISLRVEVSPFHSDNNSPFNVYFFVPGTILGAQDPSNSLNRQMPCCNGDSLLCSAMYIHKYKCLTVLILFIISHELGLPSIELGLTIFVEKYHQPGTRWQVSSTLGTLFPKPHQRWSLSIEE